MASDEGTRTAADVIAFPSSRQDADGLEAQGLREVVGVVLREERTRQGRTLVDVAGAAAVSVQYLSEVERGRKDVSSDLLRTMHEALGLELAEVLERSAERLRAVRPQRSGGLRMLAA